MECRLFQAPLQELVIILYCILSELHTVVAHHNSTVLQGFLNSYYKDLKRY